MMVVNNHDFCSDFPDFHSLTRKKSSYGSPDQSEMFSGCLKLEEKEYEPILLAINPDARRAVNRQPGYRAGTRRADTQKPKMHTWSIYNLNDTP